ncbi:tetratricopeptide repeat protein [Pararhodonellum marinum]|uniref:hypothetical protein n=1 Tax=Pararhodonellum marinum TaxID=2755358 RepID=UPI00188EC064|nr:hypothetical protein [Pararhodonellum marinum]
MKAKITLLGLLSFAILGVTQAQDNWKWPEDPQMEARAREYNAAYTDYMKAEQFIAATKPLHWLYQNAPNLNESLYINGVKIYEGAAEEVDDKTKQRVYHDSIFSIYEKREELYENQEKWIENKAYYGYKFYKDDKTKLAEALENYNKAFEIHGTISPNQTAAYFDLVRRHFLLNKGYQPEEVLEIHTKINDLLDKAEESGQDVSTPKSNVEALLVAMELIDCDFIENTLGTKLREDPTNMKMAQQVFQYSLKYKCTSSPAFLSALEIIDNEDPTFSTSQVRAIRYMQNKEYEKAQPILEKALTLAKDDAQKSEVHLDLAKVHANLGRKGAARTAARTAAELNSENAGTAWSLIGGLYMSSTNDCRQGQSRVKDYSIYIAAYDAFRRAGDNSGMSNARSRFPSKEELFTEGYQVGDTLNTGCWIAENVTLATRD